MARALMSQFAGAENLGLERAADGIQQIGQRLREFLVRSRHSPLAVPLSGHSLIPAQRPCCSIVRTPGISMASPTALASRQAAGHRLNPEVITGATLQRRRRANPSSTHVMLTVGGWRDWDLGQD